MPPDRRGKGKWESQIEGVVTGKGPELGQCEEKSRGRPQRTASLHPPNWPVAPQFTRFLALLFETMSFPSSTDKTRPFAIVFQALPRLPDRSVTSTHCLSSAGLSAEDGNRPKYCSSADPHSTLTGAPFIRGGNGGWCPRS